MGDEIKSEVLECKGCEVCGGDCFIRTTTVAYIMMTVLTIFFVVAIAKGIYDHAWRNGYSVGHTQGYVAMQDYAVKEGKGVWVERDVDVPIYGRKFIWKNCDN